MKFNFKNKTYEIEKVLGKGAFGIVYLIYDINNVKNKKTIKCYFPYKNGNGAVNFEKEYENLLKIKKLLHGCINNLICFEDIGKIELNQNSKLYNFIYNNMEEIVGSKIDKTNIYVLITSYVEGPNINDFIENYDIYVDDIKNFMEDMLPVVEVLHQNNIVHRDIKPGNIIYQNLQNFVLIDLGLSCIDDCEHLSGTPGYVIPELYYTKNPSLELYKQSDIYALGITLYQLANVDSNPFVGNTDTLKEPSHTNIKLLDEFINDIIFTRKYKTIYELKDKWYAIKKFIN